LHHRRPHVSVAVKQYVPHSDGSGGGGGGDGDGDGDGVVNGLPRGVAEGSGDASLGERIALLQQTHVVDGGAREEDGVDGKAKEVCACVCVCLCVYYNTGLLCCCWWWWAGGVCVCVCVCVCVYVCALL